MFIRQRPNLILRKYGMRLLTADEGGLAPPCESAEEMLGLAVEAIERAGYRPGKDIFLGIDVAATHFYQDRKYHLDGEMLDSAGMIQTISQVARSVSDLERGRRTRGGRLGELARSFVERSQAGRSLWVTIFCAPIPSAYDVQSKRKPAMLCC